MSAQRKIYRIEALVGRNGPRAADTPAPDDRHREIIAELRALRRLVEPQEQVSTRMLDTLKHEMAQAQKLKIELDAISEAIVRTKREIASVHVTGFNGVEMARVTNELDAIVTGTQQATEAILSAAEDIDQQAGQLQAAIRDEHDRQVAADIQERVVGIFEACNFQDLTGQRITKVVNTLQFIEERIVRMMEIWGGIESFQDIEVEMIPERDGDAKLINGPKLADEAGHASQDDIDALFG